MKFFLLIYFCITALLITLVSLQSYQNDKESETKCKENIKGWEIRYMDLRKDLPLLIVDEVILAAISIAKLLPNYVGKLHKIIRQCNTVMENQDSDAEHDRQDLLALKDKEHQLLQEITNNLHNNITNRHESQIFNLIQTLTELHSTVDSRNLDRFIIAEFIKIVDTIKLQQREFTININKIILDTLINSKRLYPTLSYFIYLAELRMKTSIEMNFLKLNEHENFTNLKMLLNELANGLKTYFNSLMRDFSVPYSEIQFLRSTILFLNKVLDKIYKIIDLDDKKLYFSVFLYQEYNSSELKMKDLCNYDSIQDISYSNSLCEWLTQIINDYCNLMKKYDTLMRDSTNELINLVNKNT
jgi:hypothetical protein